MKRAATQTTTDGAQRRSKHARVDEHPSALTCDAIAIPSEYKGASIVASDYNRLFVGWENTSKVSCFVQYAGTWTTAPCPAFTTTCNALCSVEGARKPEEIAKSIAAIKGREPDEFVCVRAPQVDGPGEESLEGRAAHSIVVGLDAMASLGRECIITLDSKTKMPLDAVYVVHDGTICAPIDMAILEDGAAVVCLNNSQTSADILHINSLREPRKVTPIVFNNEQGEDDRPTGTVVPGPHGSFHIVSDSGIWWACTLDSFGTPKLLYRFHLKDDVICISACPLGVFVLLNSGLRLYSGAYQLDFKSYTEIGYTPAKGVDQMRVARNPNDNSSYRAFISGSARNVISVVDFTVAVESSPEPTHGSRTCQHER